jgi:hypothetical protein
MKSSASSFRLGWSVITAQGGIADVHFLPEITKKMVVGGVRPPQPSFWDFLGTLRCNTIDL